MKMGKINYEKCKKCFSLIPTKQINPICESCDYLENLKKSRNK